MTDANGTKMQLNFKTPTGALINLYAESEEELDEQLAILGRTLPAIGQVEAVLAAMENIYTGTSPIEQIKLNAEKAANATVSSPGPAPAWAGANQGASNGMIKLEPGQPNSKGEAAPICQHGPMYWKEFTSKAGKPIKGWFCAPNVDGCKPQFRY